MSRACSRAWTRASPNRSPGIRVPSVVTIGTVRSVKAWAPRTGSWLMRWAPSRATVGGEADLPQRGQVGQPFRQSEVPGVVDRGLGPQRPPFLVVLLDLGVLVVDVQGGRHALGDDPGAESARCLAAALEDDSPVEDQGDLVWATDVEVVVQHPLEEDPTGDRAV